MPDAPAAPPFVQPGDLLADFLRSFWQRQVDTAEQETPDFRHPPLPLARIKKVMKSDPEVKMIAADAPILFCKACEIFITEITARAFIVADANKRRTLSRADIAKALSKSDQFDFLIDIVPREDAFPGAKRGLHHAATGSISGAGAPSASAGSTSTLHAGTGTAGMLSHASAPGPVIKRDEDMHDRYPEVLELEDGDQRMSEDVDMGLGEMQNFHPAQSMDRLS